SSTTLQTEASSIPARRFLCPEPGCGRSFGRKEHLNRHAKSHDLGHAHECSICGRRYAR
ncbi:hypothetical protein BD289DRAFT_333806, partial [Coniella lustricola]